MTRETDSGYKYLFSFPELVRDLILGFVPDEWLHDLDYATLEQVPASFVSADMQQRHSDVIWRVKVSGEWVYLYILLEIQSTVDRYMALRMLVYVGLLYQDLIKNKQLSKNSALPPVLPIVLYNGGRTWTAKQDIGELIAQMPGNLAKFQPQMRYQLIEENRYTETELLAINNIVAAIFGVETSQADNLKTRIAALLAQLDLQSPLAQAILNWLKALVFSKSKQQIDLNEIESFEGVMTMLAENLDKWAEENFSKGKTEGRAEGRVEGEALVLQKILTKRFGPIPNHLTALIANADFAQLELWLDRALDVDSLDGVFNSTLSMSTDDIMRLTRGE